MRRSWVYAWQDFCMWLRQLATGIVDGLVWLLSLPGTLLVMLVLLWISWGTKDDE